MLPSSRAEAKTIGSKQYDTGRPCPHGHYSPRLTSDGGCLTCSKHRSESRRRAKPEYASEQYHKTKMWRSLKGKEYYQRNKEALLEYGRQWVKGNHELQLTMCAEWRKKNNIKQRQIKLEQFQELIKNYSLTEAPSEHDFKYWLAGQIADATGWQIHNETYLDEERTSRIDLLIPEAKIGIEVKLSAHNWSMVRVEEQRQRYERLLDGYTVLLVSLDGSIGLSAVELLDQLV